MAHFPPFEPVTGSSEPDDGLRQAVNGLFLFALADEPAFLNQLTQIPAGGGVRDMEQFLDLVIGNTPLLPSQSQNFFQLLAFTELDFFFGFE